ncbi:DUF1772 domain-containing protein [Nocardia puris]|uniref:Uncharacterized protein DUF1772 n=1 Tax=Nocardia puris TaxID=208602 RepID=A0A366E1N8_9NOCA|nr:DUF1772 domain-containing protein [Nocardia puris]MBF6209505.1 DUF1772 domain-containing protein [Nocardia puris]MBF6366077.1 DUF1772 domain-containing protein [Nocardia puris]MBF6458582.1 DUF1772 domain-containing protein [Nocardia puris]RBO96233.1 uncharacterized protein DUF1772 [Nocardia puris]
MRRQWFSLGVPGLYVWIAMVAFGGIAVETIVIYPNVFHDVPASLAEASAFFEITGPADFFPPMGAATVLAAVVSTVLVWRTPARWWVAGSLGTLVLGEFLFSVLYFWPRNEIMFDEGAAVHSTETLRRTATEFETGHWGRLAMSAVTATLAFLGFLRLYRDRVGVR